MCRMVEKIWRLFGLPDGLGRPLGKQGREVSRAVMAAILLAW
jgi:hypothetical protein